MTDQEAVSKFGGVPVTVQRGGGTMTFVMPVRTYGEAVEIAMRGILIHEQRTNDRTEEI